MLWWLGHRSMVVDTLPPTRGGHGEALVDGKKGGRAFDRAGPCGRSSARPGRLLARDAFHVATAVEADPAALASVAGTLSEASAL